MQNRLARIIKPEDNRAVMLAVDHGYFLGPTSGLEQPRKTIEPLLSYADSIMLTRGVLRTSVDPKSDKPVVLRVSGGTSILKELSNEDITVSIDDCIRLNVSAMALSIFVGSEFEKETLVSLAKLVDEVHAGTPVVLVHKDKLVKLERYEPFDPDRDSPELEAMLLQAVTGRHSPYSKKDLIAIASKVRRELGRK